MENQELPMTYLSLLIKFCRISLLLLPGVSFLAGASGDDLLDIEIEDLMQVEITSVSKKPEQLMNAAAAVYVITHDDIQRAGVSSIPEALRLAPGMHVARIDANKWAISSRGFLDRFSSKLLVLIDGRSVYTPTFSGVYWDVQDVLLDDVERIEVIRGPGATLWGANAVNGVVNVITKHAKDTLSGTASGAVGDTEKLAHLRYGTSLGEGRFIRGYVKHRDTDDLATPMGEGRDAWNISQAGVRADIMLDANQNWTIQGDLYSGGIEQLIVKPLSSLPYTTQVPGDVEVSGANLLTRWVQSQGNNEWSLQLYFDHSERDDQILWEKRQTWDIDLQQHRPFENKSELVWGVGLRYSADDTRAGETARLIPVDDQFTLLSAFIQYDYPLSESVRLVVGSKFEDHDYSGFDTQPNIRLHWRLSDDSALWTSVAKAVRIPSRGERDAQINVYTIPPMTQQNASPWPIMFQIVGNRDMEPNRLWAYEAGYRQLLSPGLILDAAAFYNDYEQLESLSLGPLLCLPSMAQFPLCPLSDYLVQQGFINNGGSGYTQGIEILLDWNASLNWKIQTSYSYLKTQQSDANTASSDIASGLAGFDGTSPKHQFGIRGHWQFAPQWSLHLGVRHVSELPAIDIEKYTVADVRLAWQPRRELELSLRGENLGKKHLEFAQGLILGAPSYIEPSVRFDVRWRF
jgi:iron complex outermembrane recepter protein